MSEKLKKYLEWRDYIVEEVELSGMRETTSDVEHSIRIISTGNDTLPQDIYNTFSNTSTLLV